MYQELLRFGLRVSMLVGLGLSGAQAAAIRSLSPVALGLEAVSMPVAMCGYSCRSGGRYIPGPPGVCSARGLNYCGSSQGWAGHLGHLLGAGTAGTMGEAPTGAVPAMAVGRMGVAPRLTEGEPMGVGLSPREEVLGGVLKPRSRSRLRRATPTDKGLGGADRACVEDPNSSKLRVKPLPGSPQGGASSSQRRAGLIRHAARSEG